jgi:hypothetical protein
MRDCPNLSRLAVWLVLLAAACASEAPIGPWASIDTVVNTPERPKLQAEFEEARARVCMPKPSELSLPVFPEVEAYDVDWTKQPPACDIAARPGDRRVSLILLSKRSPAEVRSWYESRLPQFGRHEVDDSLLLMEGLPADFSWPRDWSRTRDARFVMVGPLRTNFPSVAALGYRTVIDIGDPGPSR